MREIFGRKKRERGSTAGFTLLEMAIVVLVIAILASIAIPKIAGALQRSKEGALRGNLTALRSAVTGWSYNNVLGDQSYGRVSINCTHIDSKGSAWTSY